MAWIKGAPWCRYKDADDGDGEIPEGVPDSERVGDQSGGLQEGGNRVVFINTREGSKGFLHYKSGCGSFGDIYGRMSWMFQYA